MVVKGRLVSLIRKWCHWRKLWQLSVLLQVPGINPETAQSGTGLHIAVRCQNNHKEGSA
jgi:hypothetical protein